jgi:hypothetical protein
MHLRASCLATIVFLAASSFTIAQAQATDDKSCTPPERSNKTLDEHDQSNAEVLCPPEIDPGMTAPTPKTGDRSVILPPGTPGGAPSVQPK